MPGDVVLMKLDAFQVKRKVKDWWSEAEHMVVCKLQMTYPHMRYEATVGTLRSSTTTNLVELAPLEWESEAPESKVDEALTQCLTSHVLLGWVDGILWPLPSVALQPALQGLGSGDGMSSLSDKEVH